MIDQVRLCVQRLNVISLPRDERDVRRLLTSVRGVIAGLRTRIANRDEAFARGTFVRAEEQLPNFVARNREDVISGRRRSDESTHALAIVLSHVHFSTEARENVGRGRCAVEEASVIGQLPKRSIRTVEPGEQFSKDASGLRVQAGRRAREQREDEECKR